MIKKITRAYVRRYSDNGQVRAYVEWIDTRGKSGRTEGNVTLQGWPGGSHMIALFERAIREGVEIGREEW